MTWGMLTDGEGNLTNEIRLQDKASKDRSSGVVYQSKRIQAAIQKYVEGHVMKDRAVVSQRGSGMTAQVVIN